MALLQTIVVAVVTLGVLVSFHEFGHFWVARRCGVKVLRFSVGFGFPLLRTRDASGTEYALCAIPLGGYVRMLDEREGEVPAAQVDQAFNRKSVWARIAIVAAGPAANFLLAIAVFWFLFLRGETGLVPLVAEVTPDTPAYFAGLEAGQEIIAVDGRETPTASALSLRLLDRLGDTGVIRIATKYPDSDVVYESSAELDRWLVGVEAPDPIAGFGISLRTPVIEPIIDQVIDGGAAAQSGFESGDRIVSADGVAMPTWSEWVAYVRARPGVAITTELERGTGYRQLSVTPDSKQVDGETIGAVGMSVQVPPVPESMVRVFDRGPIDALTAAFTRTYDLTVFTFESIGKMARGLISPKNLSGPITIAQVAASTAESGLDSWLGFLALLSISLGALNLLPIPVLDGGHLLFYGVEAIIGRPIPERVQAAGYQVGLAMVLSIMVFALYNDVVKL